MSHLILLTSTFQTGYSEVSDWFIKHANQFLRDVGLSSQSADSFDRLVILAGVFLVAYITYLLLSKVVIRGVHGIVKRTKTRYDTILYDNFFFHRLFGLVPPLLVEFLAPLAFKNPDNMLLGFIEKGVAVYVTIIFIKVCTALINSAFQYFANGNSDGYQTYKSAAEIMKISVIVFGCLVIVGIFLSKSVAGVITGLSAFAAVLMLIFKDTLLGFIAGLQLAEYKMVKVGDWIVVPDSLANGTVIEMSLITIKVQNFDNTIVTVPPYSLISGQFQNWKGMSDSGVRRIKKTILLDQLTIKRIDESFIAKVKDNPILGGYLDDKYMTENTGGITTSPRDMTTNVGLFRVWVQHYLQNNPDVSVNPYIVLQGDESTGAGYPFLLNFFINTTVWQDYEIIQSRIFEEIMTAVEVFDLKLFQYKTSIQSGLPQ